MLLIYSLVINACIIIHDTNMMTSLVMIVTRHSILTLLWFPLCKGRVLHSWTLLV